MGWYGDYRTSKEVMEGAIADYVHEGYEVLEFVVKTTYGALLIQEKGKGDVSCYCYIFSKSDSAYKPVSFLYDSAYFKRIPTSWHKRFNREIDMNEISNQKETIKQAKKAKALEPSLDDVLIPGNMYRIYPGNLDAFAKYERKKKRTHLFKTSWSKGEYTNYVKANAKGIKDLGNVNDADLSSLPDLLTCGVSERTFIIPHKDGDATWSISILPIFKAHPNVEVSALEALTMLKYETGRTVRQCSLDYELGAYDWHIVSSYSFDDLPDFKTTHELFKVSDRDRITEGVVSRMLSLHYDNFIISKERILIQKESGQEIEG